MTADASAGLTGAAEVWPIAGAFTISRGSKTEAQVVVARFTRDGVTGHGECVPYPRYGETVEGVLAEIEGVAEAVAADPRPETAQTLLPPGAARNAVDCALWDWRAKATGVRAWTTAGHTRLSPLETAYTLSYGAAETMAAAARAAAHRPLLKLKIGGPDDLDRLEAVRAAAPLNRLVVDANEGLSFDDLRRLAPDLKRLDVRLVEQPLPADADAELEGWPSPVPLCADESLHTRAELDACARRYACVNIKLDKTGGLTEALALSAEAEARGLMRMVGCMVATSLSMAPATVVAQGAAFVDLDGPLLLARDRTPGLSYNGSMVEPPDAALWG